MNLSTNWVFLSLACAFFAATLAALSKIALRKKSELFVLWAIYAFSLPLFLILSIHQPKPQLTGVFWKTVAVLLPFEITAFFLYLRALRISPLSLVFPLLGLTPAFSILTSSIILKEKLAFYGIGGVILVSFGAYLLNANTIKKDGIFAPIKNIYKEKGPMLMILVAFIYAFTSVLGKKAVLLSSPETFPAIYYSIFFAGLTPLVYVKLRRTNIMLEKKDLFLFILAGISFGIAVLFHYKAISLVNVPYMLSVKRLSLVISVFYGAIIFKEKNIAYRLAGSLVMLCGVLILLLCA
ncbi:MAG: DMT family transporter [Candidatus Omnitrophota bacterium]|nr:MAG: DMT family transporter [Candidatus Omnitrophota bacterium]